MPSQLLHLYQLSKVSEPVFSLLKFPVQHDELLQLRPGKSPALLEALTSGLRFQQSLGLETDHFFSLAVNVLMSEITVKKIEGKKRTQEK